MSTKFVAAETRVEILRVIRAFSPRPIELLALLPGKSYEEVQDALAQLIDTERVSLDDQLRLRAKIEA